MLYRASSWSFALVLAALAAPAPAQSGVQNFPQRALTSGYNSQAMVTTDLDHDGIDDVVVAEFSGRLSIYRNRPGGTLGSPQAHKVSVDPRSIVAGDFDADGNTDLAVACQIPGDVCVLLGDGAGGIRSNTKISTLPFVPYQLITADVDVDGDVDLVLSGHALFAIKGVDVLAGDGLGGFFPLAPSAVPNGGLGVGDIDQDGFVDVVSPHDWSTTSLSLALGNGLGAFNLYALIPMSQQVSEVALADLDHDGRLDIVVAGNSGKVFTLHANAPASFDGPIEHVIGYNGVGGLIVRDLDRDGWLDILAEVDGQLTVLRGTGAGAFAAPTHHHTGEVFGIAVSDLDADGRLDAAVLRGGVFLISGDGAGGFDSVPNWPLATNYHKEVQALDIEGDGDLDLVATGGNHGEVMLGDGQGGIVNGNDAAGLDQARCVTFGDWNGDGVLDVAHGMAYWLLRVALGDGNGQGTVFIGASVLQLGANAASIDNADMDGDGDLDLVVALENNAVAVFNNDGAGHFALASTVVVNYAPLSLDVGRIDGDAYPDVVVSVAAPGFAGAVAVLINNGAGGFGPPTNYPSERRPIAVKLADLDQDGDLDMVNGNNISKFLDVRLGTGNGGFAAAVQVPLGYAPMSLAVADVDADGALDLITSGNALTVCFGDGSGGFGPPRGYLADTTVATAADFNGDGLVDLIGCGGGTLLFFQREHPILQAYCTAGVTTNGCNPSLTSTGLASASAGSGFTVRATHVEGQKQGLFFYGLSGPLASPWGASSSTLCVKAPTQRTQSQSSGGAPNSCDGALSIDWNAFIAGQPSALGNPFSGGESVYIQAWFRDPPSPKTTNLTNALKFVVQP